MHEHATNLHIHKVLAVCTNACTCYAMHNSCLSRSLIDPLVDKGVPVLHHLLNQTPLRQHLTPTCGPQKPCCSIHCQPKVVSTPCTHQTSALNHLLCTKIQVSRSEVSTERLPSSTQTT